ncbi:Uncharacterized protein PCOAH_00052650 [Plasmodium coatneyi]|uniref:Uncharacterized protein n=1 Tax=Plasmodium coatneyi TaxID=208452 RepID=A0A1B1E7M3_9APIC|nr:Uncharacterized protein PCOAH_00052650 [Plasmodium coatneyi]ANQ11001.1 Uncharacterized protein PCOAH_00052650 [Plasmodium coatneyi]
MEKGKLLNILERELKEYGDEEMLVLYHQFYKSAEANERDIAEKAFSELIHQMKNFFVIYDKRSKGDLIERVKNSFKEESNEVNIIDVQRENDDDKNDSGEIYTNEASHTSEDNYTNEDSYSNEGSCPNEDNHANDSTVDEGDHTGEKNRNRKKQATEVNLPQFRNHHSFLNSNLFENVSMDEQQCEVNIFDLYKMSLEIIAKDEEEKINEHNFYETFQYFLNLLCLLYFLKNVYFDLNYKTNENSYSFLFKGFEERKNNVINYFCFLKKIQLDKLLDNEVVKIFCNFFQYTYINEYLIRNIFDTSMNTFLFTAVVNFRNNYIVHDGEGINIHTHLGKGGIITSDGLPHDVNGVSTSMANNSTADLSSINVNKSNGEFNPSEPNTEQSGTNAAIPVGATPMEGEIKKEYNMKEFKQNSYNTNEDSKNKKNQEDYLNKELNNFFISNNTFPKGSRNSFVEIIYQNEVHRDIYSDETINALFYFFNNPYLIFSFHKNVLYYIEKKSKDKDFFHAHRNAHALIKYLNYCVTTMSKIFHIFISAGLFFNHNIFEQEKNKYLNFCNLLNFDNVSLDQAGDDHSENFRTKYSGSMRSSSSSADDRRRNKRRGSFSSESSNSNTFRDSGSDVGSTDRTIGKRYRSRTSVSSSATAASATDMRGNSNLHDFNIVKYLMKYRNVVGNFCQDDFNRKDSFDSDGEMKDVLNFNINPGGAKWGMRPGTEGRNAGRAHHRGSYSEDSLSDSESRRSSTNGGESQYQESKYEESDNLGNSDNVHSESRSSSSEGGVDSQGNFPSSDDQRSDSQYSGDESKRGRKKTKSKGSPNRFITKDGIYQHEYTNKNIFNDILRKAKKKKKFYQVISNINKLKNSFDVNRINKNKMISLDYVENVDTISYFISLYNSDNIFQFDYYFLKFVTEIATTYNSYMKAYLIPSQRNARYKKDELEKMTDQMEYFLKEITKLIYVYTWCILHIFGHSYSYVKYAKYFYQKKSFFLLENKKQWVFKNFSYFAGEAGTACRESGDADKGEDGAGKRDSLGSGINLARGTNMESGTNGDVHMNHFFTPHHVVENLKYNYELKKNTNLFDKLSCADLIQIYKNSYFQNIVDKLHLNLKFIENIHFTLNNALKSKKKKKKKFLQYLCVKDQKLEDICNSIDNLKRNISKYKRTFHYCLNFNNIKNVIVLTLEEMSMNADKLELNKMLNEYLNKLESRGQIKKRQKKINVKIIDNNIVLDTNRRKKRRKHDGGRSGKYNSNDVMGKKLGKEKRKNSSGRNSSMSSSFLQIPNGRNSKTKETAMSPIETHIESNTVVRKGRRKDDNEMNIFTDNESCYDGGELNQSYTKSDYSSRHATNDSHRGVHGHRADGRSARKATHERGSRSPYYDSTISTSSSGGSVRSKSSNSDSGNGSSGSSLHSSREEQAKNLHRKVKRSSKRQTHKGTPLRGKNNPNEESPSGENILMMGEYNTERLIFFFNLLNGNNLFYYLALHYLVKNEKIMDILHFFPLKYLLDLLILYDLKDYIKFKTIIRVFRIIYEFKDFSPTIRNHLFLNRKNYYLDNADFMNFDFVCKFLTISKKDLLAKKQSGNSRTCRGDRYGDIFLPPSVVKTNRRENYAIEEGEHSFSDGERIQQGRSSVRKKERQRSVRDNLLHCVRNTFSVINLRNTVRSFPTLMKNLLNRILISLIGKYSYLSNDQSGKEHKSITFYALRFIFNNLKNITLGYSKSSFFSYTINDPTELYNMSIHNFILYHIYDLAVRTKELAIKSSCFKLLKYLLTEYYYYPEVFNEKAHELINSDIKLNNIFVKNVILDFVSFNIMICHLQKELTSDVNVLNHLDLFNYSIKSIANYLIGYKNNSIFFLMDKKMVKSLLIKLTFMMPFIYKLKIPACVVRLYIRIIKSLDKDILDMIHNFNKIELIYDSLFYIIVRHFIYFFLNMNIELDEEASNILPSTYKSGLSRNSWHGGSHIKVTNEGEQPVDGQPSDDQKCDNGDFFDNLEEDDEDKQHGERAESPQGNKRYLTVEDAYGEQEQQEQRSSDSEGEIDHSSSGASGEAASDANSNANSDASRSGTVSGDDSGSNTGRSAPSDSDGEDHGNALHCSPEGMENASNANSMSDVQYLRKIISENGSFNLENNYFVNYSLYILHKEHYSIYVFFSSFFKNVLKEYREISRGH